MHTRLSDRIQALSRPGTTWFRALAQEAANSGVNVLPLRGSPRITPEPHVVSAVAEAAKARDATAPARGLLGLRAAIASKVAARNEFQADPDSNVIVTNGAKHGLLLAFLSLLDTGDEVLVPAPSYVYGDLVALAGATPVFVPMPEEDAYRLDVGALEAAVNRRTRAVVINSPNNPTGRVITRDELDAISGFVTRHGLALIVDEAHEHLTYDGRRHLSAASLPELTEATVTVFTLSKAHGLAGARVGYMVGPPDLVASAEKLIEITQQACAYLPQVAAEAVLTGPTDWMDGVRDLCQSNRDFLSEGLARIDRLQFLPPDGGTSYLLNVGSVAPDSTKFALHLLQEWGIPATPGEVFRAPGRIRLSAMGSERIVLEEMLHRLGSAVATYGQGIAAASSQP